MGWQGDPLDDHVARVTRERDDARAELAEANAELARHHRDFGEIRRVLDEIDEQNRIRRGRSCRDDADALSEIRGIVG